MKWRFALCLIILGLMWLKHSQVRRSFSPSKAETVSLKTAEATATPQRVPASASAPELITPITYQSMLDKDLFCEAARVSVAESSNRRTFLRSLGLEMDSRYRELTEENSPLDNAAITGQSYSSAIARLTQALRLAGLLVGTQGPESTDLNAAWDLLNQLHREDPSNAAYPLFRLVVEHDLQKEPEAIRATAEDLLRATHINSLFTEFGSEVFARMQNNASKFNAGLEFLATLPMPDYQSVRQALIDLDMDFPGVASRLGQMMVQPGISSAGASMTWTFNALEYTLGRNLAPEVEAPKLSDLDKMKSKRTHRWQTPLDLDEQIWSSCDREVQQKLRSGVRDIGPL